jgi:uncharacterized protein (DUF1015 family)
MRFATELPGDLAGVIGPPADIDSTAEARAWVDDRAYNAVRLEIEDRDDELEFTAARSLLERWRRDGILRVDESPSYYVYDQTFDDHGVQRTRRGVFGLVPLDAPDVCVLPHENTWEDNRLRRLQLLRDLDASISPIFLIYESRESRTALAAATNRAPDAEATGPFGNTHRLWRVSDPDDVENIRQAMQGQHYYIADGHHRYEAARMYHDEIQRPETGLVLACCVEASDPGVVIRPIHRLLHTTSAADWAARLDDIHRWFDVQSEPIEARSGRDLLRSLPDDDQPIAGVITDGGDTFSTLRLRTDMPENTDDPAAHLDVSVVTDRLMQRALGIEPQDMESAISYVDDPDAVLAAVRDGSAGIGILLRPVRLAQVLAVASAHGRVPAKSTSFIPKVPIGLVMQAFDEGRDA